jgi:insulysin
MNKRVFFCTTLTLISLSLHAAGGYQIVENKATLPLLNPALSERKVLKIRLDNGLEAQIVSDPGAKQSAAALSVESGSWNDPKEYPGMAHFLEHMLFMGTAAYPKEFEYMQFIADNGGLVNAYTAPDKTVYMFSINNEAFGGAMDRFSHFFIDPLFSPSCIGRELHAVDQEHSKNIENDAWREYMILKETGNPGHPNSAFSTGNAKTLSGIPQSALKKWYEANYSATKMHLAVLSPLPLEQLTQVVVNDFSKIPTRQKQPLPAYLAMSSPAQKGHITYIKPIKDIKRLSLVWELDQTLANDNEKKAVELIAYVLKNSSKNSLLEELKQEKLAEEIEIVGDRFGKSHMLFRIDIALTKQGVAQIDTLVTRCFQAIARLKETNVPATLFNEMKTLAKLSYQYQSREDAFQTVMRQADEMVNEDLATYPEKTVIPTTYDATYISSFLQALTPEQCMFFVQADPALSGVTPDKKEKWMNAEYAVQKVPTEKMVLWATAAPHPQIGIPAANPFVPTQLALLPTHPEAAQTPQLVVDDSLCRAYYAQDSRYLVPETALFVGIKTPLIDGSTKHIVLTDLFSKALNEQLSSTLFFAETAGLSAQFGEQDLKFCIAISGYSEKAPGLLKEIAQTLRKVATTPEQFELFKQSLVSNYDNASKELPFRQAVDMVTHIIFNNAPLAQEKLKAIKAVTYDEFKQFAAQLFKTAYIEAMVYGNLGKTDAQQLCTDVKNQLAAAPFPKDQQARKRVLVLPDKHGPYMITQATERQGNGVVLLLEEGPFSLEKRVAQQILGKALHDAFFDTLRTKQQTGYIAKAWDTEVERQLLQFFAVQSNSHHPSDLLARFELFLEDFVTNFQERLPAERFETMREAQIVSLKKPPENLFLMARRLNDLAFNYDGDFGLIDKFIDSLSKLTYQQLSTDAHNFLSRKNQRRLAVLMEGVLPPEKDFHYERTTHEDMRGLGTYVTWK